MEKCPCVVGDTHIVGGCRPVEPHGGTFPDGQVGAGVRHGGGDIAHGDGHGVRVLLTHAVHNCQGDGEGPWPRERMGCYHSLEGHLSGPVMEGPCMIDNTHVVRTGTAVEDHGPSFVHGLVRARAGRWGCGIHHDRHGIRIPESCGIRYVEGHEINSRTREGVRREYPL